MDIELRASGLSGAPGCFRSWAHSANASDPKDENIKGVADLVRAKGFTARRNWSDSGRIGNSVGTACHEGINTLLLERMDGRTADPQALSAKKFADLSKGGMEFDKETPNFEVARYQMERMIAAYLPVALTLKPTRVEFSLKQLIDPQKRFWLTGHPDIAEEDSIIDLKFGKRERPYEAQLGAYSLLGRTIGMNISRLEVHHTKRGAKTKPQPDPVITRYDQRVAEVTARKTLDIVIPMVEKFKETGDPWSFPANPNSQLCSKKWCSAWGTDFCDLGRPEKSEGEN